MWSMSGLNMRGREPVSIYAMLLMACVAAAPVRAAVLDEIPGVRVVGQGIYRFFGMRIYEARLWATPAGVHPDTPYALELTYFHDIARRRFVDTSIDEMQRIQGQLAPETTERWRAAMERAFVDIRSGERMLAVFRGADGVRFFHNDQLTADIKDPAFAQAFAAIWLSPATRDPALRAALLGTARPPESSTRKEP